MIFDAAVLPNPIFMLLVLHKILLLPEIFTIDEPSPRPISRIDWQKFASPLSFNTTQLVPFGSSFNEDCIEVILLAARLVRACGSYADVHEHTRYSYHDFGTCGQIASTHGSTACVFPYRF